MSESGSHSSDLLPIELKLKLLQAELERLDSDADWIEVRRREIVEEIGYFERLLEKAGRRPVLKRVK